MGWEGTIIGSLGDSFGLLRVQYGSVVGFVWDALHWGLGGNGGLGVGGF